MGYITRYTGHILKNNQYGVETNGRFMNHRYLEAQFDIVNQLASETHGFHVNHSIGEIQM